MCTCAWVMIQLTHAIVAHTHTSLPPLPHSLLSQILSVRPPPAVRRSLSSNSPRNADTVSSLKDAAGAGAEAGSSSSVSPHGSGNNNRARVRPISMVLSPRGSSSNGTSIGPARTQSPSAKDPSLLRTTLHRSATHNTSPLPGDQPSSPGGTLVSAPLGADCVIAFKRKWHRHCLRQFHPG